MVGSISTWKLTNLTFIDYEFVGHSESVKYVHSYSSGAVVGVAQSPMNSNVFAAINAEGLVYVLLSPPLFSCHSFFASCGVIWEVLSPCPLLDEVIFFLRCSTRWTWEHEMEVEHELNEGGEEAPEKEAPFQTGGAVQSHILWSRWMLDLMLPSVGGHLMCSTISPSGRRAAVGTSLGVIQVFHLDTGTLFREFSLFSIPVRGIVWCNEDSFVAYGAKEFRPTIVLPSLSHCAFSPRQSKSILLHSIDLQRGVQNLQQLHHSLEFALWIGYSDPRGVATLTFGPHPLTCVALYGVPLYLFSFSSFAFVISLCGYR